jgi:hypothetical protein
MPNKLITVHVFRCTGKVDNLVVYKINVVANGHKHAERTADLWHQQFKDRRDVKVRWQCKIITMKDKLYMEWEGE